MERGSILVLTLIVTLVLSLMVTGLLTVGTTELYTTQNYHMDRISHYYAMEGMEIIKNSIQKSEDPPSIALPGTPVEENAISKKYYIGSLLDIQDQLQKTVEIFEGFPAPPLTGMSLGSNSNIVPVVWEVYVTSEISQGNRKTYSEIKTGVYSIMKEY